MSNRQYSVLQQVVSEYIGMPSTTGRGAYLAGLAINEEIDNLDSRNFFFMRAFADLTLVSGSVTYSLSTTWPNFKTHIASVLLNAAGTLRERYILYLTPEDFRRVRDEDVEQLARWLPDAPRRTTTTRRTPTGIPTAG